MGRVPSLFSAERTSSFHWNVTLDIGEIGKLLAEQEENVEIGTTEKPAIAAHAFLMPGIGPLVVHKKTTDDEKGQTQHILI